MRVRCERMWPRDYPKQSGLLGLRLSNSLSPLPVDHWHDIAFIGTTSPEFLGCLITVVKSLEQRGLWLSDDSDSLEPGIGLFVIKL